MLKKKQVIKWKEAVGGNKYRDNASEKRMSLVTETSLAAVCMLIFMLSSRIMLKEVFAWGEFQISAIFIAFILLAIVCAVMEISYHIEKKYGIYVRCGVLIVGAVCALLYLWMDSDGVVLSGLKQAGNHYMVSWDKYYGGAESNAVIDAENIEAGLNFIFIIVSFLLLWIARMIRKNIVFAVSPIIVMVLELLVGYAPKELSLFFMFIGILVANASRWLSTDFNCSHVRRRHNANILKNFMWIVVGVGAILLYGIVKLLGESSADDMAASGRDFKKFQEEFVDDVANWSVWELFGAVPESGIISGDWGTRDSHTDKLSNEPLHYKNETVLTVEMYDKLRKNIYLRGYYADTYNDSVWELDYDTFEDACDDNGYDVDEMSEKVLSLSSSKLEDYSNENWYGVTVRYKKTGSERAFYPYFIRFEDGKDIPVEGDGRYKKDEDDDELSFYMWSHESYYRYSLDTFEKAKKYDWEKWYEDYVLEHYTKVPEGMANVEKIASIVDERRTVHDGSNVININRLEAAEALVDWFNINTNYTMKPPTLPADEDPVEYFLGTSKKGYCMHYASSAVLILRTLGIPTRYATGYVVDAGLFEQKQALMYQAEVLDSRAHAWIEIYLDGVGWVPVEVTRGYNTINLDYLFDEYEEDTSVNEEDSVEEESSTPEETTSEEETTNPVEEESSNDENISDENGGGVGDDGTLDEDSKGSSSGAFKIILICLFVVAASAGVVLLVIKRKKLYNEQLLREIKRKRTVRAIRRMNKRIYYKVRIDGKVLKTNLRDDEYEKLLKKTYTDVTEKEWGRFMVVVKAATFSDIDLAQKEMEFCYAVYKRVMKKS